jgi:hypothetical protein
MQRLSAGRRWLVTAATVVATAGFGVVGVSSGAQAAPAVTANQIAVPKPAMGWASWNTFAAKIDYKVIKAQVDAIVASGLKDAGYEYVNIDEGWWQGTRDAAGNITIDESEWPGGMKAIADYIHGKGLKAGIYTDAGKDGCGYYFPTGRPAAPGSGSEGHYEQDMTAFSEWGFDFVKVDWCGGDAEKLDPKTTFEAVSAAVKAASAKTGRPLHLSICNWGRGNPWNWAPGLAPMWRTANDIILFGQSATLDQVLTSFDQTIQPTAHHTGFVNDPDMLTVGMPGLGDAQARTEMNLWAIAGAPLLAGNDVTTMSAGTKAVLTNRDVIAVDQDARGLQGTKVAEDSPGQQVYGKVLSGTGRRAVVLLNRTSAPATMSARWSDLGLADGTAAVKNLWTGATAESAASHSVSVPANDSVILAVTGTEPAATGYEAEATGNTFTGGASAGSCPGCSGGSKVGGIGNGEGNTLTVNGVKADSNGLAVATIAYLNGETTARTATLAVNGQVPTVVAFPPTGSWSTTGTVSVTVSLQKGSRNSVKFSNSSAWAPDLDAIAFAPIPGSYGNQIIGGASTRCLDINNNTIDNGTPATLWDCGGGRNQTWTHTPTKQLVVYGNKCLDAWDHGRTNGTAVVIWNCTGGTNQQWTVKPDGTITGVQSGLCLDASGAGTANGTKLVLWSCNGAANQQWTLDAPPVSPGPDPSPTVTPTVSPTVTPTPGGGVDAGADDSGVEGYAIALTGSVPAGSAPPTWSYTAGSDVDAGATCIFADTHAAATTVTCTDDGTFVAKLTTAAGSDTATLKVSNAAPVAVVATEHVADSAPVASETTVRLSVGVSDAGANDALTCRADWQNGSVTAGVLSGTKCTVTTTQTPVGVVRPTMIVEDGDGGTSTVTMPYVVTYVAGAGYVAGSGWFTSAEGNLRADKKATGEASIVFSARIGAPEGESFFQLDAGRLKFQSTSQSGATAATKAVAVVEGTGTVNGTGAYRFQISVQDGDLTKQQDTDSVNIKIWEPTTGKVIYDVKGSKRIDLSGGGVAISPQQ